jgi:hypothetical protein
MNVQMTHAAQAALPPAPAAKKRLRARRPSLFLPLALLAPAERRAATHNGTLSPMELRRIVAEMIG